MMVSESQLRKIIDLTIEELGENATKENIQAVVESVLKTYEQDETKGASGKISPMPPVQTKAMITVLGQKNNAALTALTAVFAKHNCDIIDISQKTLQTLFALVFIVDIAKLNAPFSDLQVALLKESQSLGLQLLAAQE